jgi:hypothetical protein
MLKIFTKNRQNIYYFLDLALRAWRVNICSMSDNEEGIMTSTSKGLIPLSPCMFPYLISIKGVVVGSGRIDSPRDEEGIISNPPQNSEVRVWIECWMTLCGNSGALENVLEDRLQKGGQKGYSPQLESKKLKVFSKHHHNPSPLCLKVVEERSSVHWEVLSVH